MKKKTYEKDYYIKQKDEMSVTKILLWISVAVIFLGVIVGLFFTSDGVSFLRTILCILGIEAILISLLILFISKRQLEKLSIVLLIIALIFIAASAIGAPFMDVLAMLFCIFFVPGIAMFVYGLQKKLHGKTGHDIRTKAVFDHMDYSLTDANGSQISRPVLKYEHNGVSYDAVIEHYTGSLETKPGDIHYIFVDPNDPSLLYYADDFEPDILITFGAGFAACSAACMVILLLIMVIIKRI